MVGILSDGSDVALGIRKNWGEHGKGIACACANPAVAAVVGGRSGRGGMPRSRSRSMGAGRSCLAPAGMGGAGGAVVFAAGLVVPWAISRQARRTAQLAAERERVAQVEADVRAVMRPLSGLAGPSMGPGRFGDSPAALLRPERQIVGFTGRKAELRSLGLWAHGSARGVVRLITGPGGVGKTRLAVEFAVRLEAQGWQCGLLEKDCGGHAIAAIAAAGKPQCHVEERDRAGGPSVAARRTPADSSYGM